MEKSIYTFEDMENLGDYLLFQNFKAPGFVQRLLRYAYSLIKDEAWRMPLKSQGRSFAFLKEYTAREIGEVFAHPKKAALTDLFMPCELFHALGLHIAAPEMLSPYNADASGFGKEFSSAKPDTPRSHGEVSSTRSALLDLAGRGSLRRPAVLAFTTLSDSETKETIQDLAAFWKTSPLVLDIPLETSEEAVLHVARQLEAMVPILEEASETRLDMKKLEEAVASSIHCQGSYEKALSLRGRVHLPDRGEAELLHILNAHLYLGTRESERAAELLLEDIARAKPIGNRKKILWMGILPGQQELLQKTLRDQKCLELVGCDLAFDGFVPMDPGRPFESMARRVVLGSFHGSPARRIGETLRRARQMQADGILLGPLPVSSQSGETAPPARQMQTDGILPGSLPVSSQSGETAPPARQMQADGILPGFLPVSSQSGESCPPARQMQADSILPGPLPVSSQSGETAPPARQMQTDGILPDDPSQAFFPMARQVLEDDGFPTLVLSGQPEDQALAASFFKDLEDYVYV